MAQPVASNTRGYVLIVFQRQKSRQARSAGQGQEGALPRRHPVPCRGARRGDHRPALHRLCAPEPPRSGFVPAPGRRSLARCVRHLRVRRLAAPADRQPRRDRHRLGRQPELCQRRLRRHRRAQPRRRGHPLSPVQRQVGRQARQIGRVPGCVRHRARHRSSEVARRARWRRVDHRRLQVQRQGRRDQGRGVGQLHRYWQGFHLHHRSEECSHHPERHGLRDRRGAEGHRHRHAAVGQRTARTGRSRWRQRAGHHGARRHHGHGRHRAAR